MARIDLPSPGEGRTDGSARFFRLRFLLGVGLFLLLVLGIGWLFWPSPPKIAEGKAIEPALTPGTLPLKIEIPSVEAEVQSPKSQVGDSAAQKESTGKPIDLRIADLPVEGVQKLQLSWQHNPSENGGVSENVMLIYLSLNNLEAETLETFHSRSSWAEYAKRNGLLLLRMSFNEDLYTELATDEIMQRFHEPIRSEFGRHFGKNMPALLRCEGNAAFWGLRWVRYEPGRFIAWTSRDAEMSAPWGGKVVAPGLLINRKPAAHAQQMRCFANLRRANPQNRVAVLAMNGEPFPEDLVVQFEQDYLRSMASGGRGKKGIWFDFETGSAPEDRIQVRTEADRFHWLPDAQLAGTWQVMASARPRLPDDLRPEWDKLAALKIDVESTEPTKAGPKVFERSLKPDRRFKKFEISVQKYWGAANGSIVFVTDSRTARRVFESPHWTDFARLNKLALIQVNVQCDWRFWDVNTAAMFSKRLANVLKPIGDKPVLIHSSGRKACLWVHRTIAANPQRFSGWIAEDGVDFPSLAQDHPVPPGLLMADTENPDILAKNLFYFEDLRNVRSSNRVLFFPLGKTRPALAILDEFQTQFAQSLLTGDSSKGKWLHVVNETPPGSLRREDVGTADYHWLPSEELYATWRVLCLERPQMPLAEISKSVVKTRVREIPELNLFLRIPGRVKKENIPVRGVLCFCTWQQEDTTLVNRLKDRSDELVRFADRNNLAVLTWNTAALLPPGVRLQELNDRQEENLSKTFDRVADDWLGGVKKICRKHDLPSNNFLIHGTSRGAIYVDRLVKRNPDLFLAAHTHIASHYEQPSQEAKDVVWLATTGELDGGYQQTKQFYEKARTMGYPILIKAGPSLGHSGRDDIWQLSMSFFDFVLFLKEQADAHNERTKGRTGTTLKAADSFRSAIERAAFFGDFINHEVYENDEGEWIPRSQRIALPSVKIAEAWGIDPFAPKPSVAENESNQFGPEG